MGYLPLQLSTREERVTRNRGDEGAEGTATHAKVPVLIGLITLLRTIGGSLHIVI